MTILFWLLTMALTGWFGFELGRRWTIGRVEREIDEFQARESERSGVKLNRIVMRR